MGGWMDGWIDGRMDLVTDRPTSGRRNRWTDGLINRSVLNPLSVRFGGSSNLWRSNQDFIEGGFSQKIQILNISWTVDSKKNKMAYRSVHFRDLPWLTTYHVIAANIPTNICIARSSTAYWHSMNVNIIVKWRNVRSILTTTMLSEETKRWNH